MTQALIVAGIAIVVCVVAYFKCPKFRHIAAGIGATLVATVVAFVVLKEEGERLKEVREKAKAIRAGRKEAERDSAETEKALDAEVRDEVEVHEGAEAEAEKLKKPGRTRMKA